LIYAVSLGNDPLCPASKFGRQMSTQLKSRWLFNTFYCTPGKLSNDIWDTSVVLV